VSSEPDADHVIYKWTRQDEEEGSTFRASRIGRTNESDTIADANRANLESD
jgi:hypothetical protein